MSAGPTPAERTGRPGSGEETLRRYLADAGLDVGPGQAAPTGTAASAASRPVEPSCPALDWAASGAMALTGWPDEPARPDGDVVAALGGAARVFTELASRHDRHLSIDPGALLCARAAVRRTPDARVRRGTTSFGGRCRLLRAGRDWVAMNLSRPDDVASLPALSDGRIEPSALDDAELWAHVAGELDRRPATELVEAAQELGLPASVLGEETDAVGSGHPWSIRAVGAAGKRRSSDRPLVVDFTALWAGPLCAHLLARAGARVLTVEATGRPDGARLGDPRLHAALHRGQDRLLVDLDSSDGLRRIVDVVSSADVVLEGSRPRALAALGLDACDFLSGRPGRTWVSITGFGRSGPKSGRVAFGDDAAVAGGLVGRDQRGDPVFCADAVADPTTGLLAAVAALASVTSGGGHLVDCSMAASSAFVNGGGRCPGRHRVERLGDGWMAFCDDTAVPVFEPWAATRARPSGARFGSFVTSAT
jgi:CoA-transferase family III